MRSPTRHRGFRLVPRDQADLDALAGRSVYRASSQIGINPDTIDKLLWGGEASEAAVDRVSAALESWRHRRAPRSA